jgi:tripartite-type tricarboxylate transporter receptor subunit TctC
VKTRLGHCNVLPLQFDRPLVQLDFASMCLSSTPSQLAAPFHHIQPRARCLLLTDAREVDSRTPFSTIADRGIAQSRGVVAAGIDALAKMETGKILYAGNTPGTLPALTGEMLRQRAGIDITFVPYPGFAAGLTDLKGGRISVIIESLSALAGAIQDGSVKLLAVASDQRLQQFPDVATVAETLPGFQATGWLALLARAGTPDSIVQTLSSALRESLADPGLKTKFAELATLATPMSPAEMQVFIQREEKNWIPVIQKAGLDKQ